MSASLRFGWRRPQALALLASVFLALGSAAWHHEHAQAPVTGCAESHDLLFGEGPRAHGIEAPAEGAGGCPICLSQRMLGQADVQVPVGASASNAGTLALAPSTEPAPALFTDTRSARAPPRV